MKVVVDALLAPLNNWSDEFIKFKIAAYPGRIYYGEIDRSKIDEVPLDLFYLLARAMSPKWRIETAFTKRLVEEVGYFAKSADRTCFEGHGEDISEDSVLCEHGQSTHSWVCVAFCLSKSVESTVNYRIKSNSGCNRSILR